MGKHARGSSWRPVAGWNALQKWPLSSSQGTSSSQTTHITIAIIAKKDHVHVFALVGVFSTFFTTCWAKTSPLVKVYLVCSSFGSCQLEWILRHLLAPFSCLSLTNQSAGKSARRENRQFLHLHDPISWPSAAECRNLRLSTALQLGTEEEKLSPPTRKRRSCLQLWTNPGFNPRKNSGQSGSPFFWRIQHESILTSEKQRKSVKMKNMENGFLCQTTSKPVCFMN